MITKEEKKEQNRIKNIKWRLENKEKYLQSAVRYRKTHPDRVKNYKLKTNYGISKCEYDQLLCDQNGKCAICGNEEIAVHNITKKKQSLAVDHCHKTKKIRGLLCQDCNRGLGKFHDDTLRLEKAIEYLKKNYE